MVMTVKTDRYSDGRIRNKYWYLDGQLHREDGPAVMSYDAFGSLNNEVWWNRGRIHRIGGPAILYYLVDVKRTETWCQDNEKHREDGPAVISYNDKGRIEIQEWWIRGDKRRTTHYVGGRMSSDVWKKQNKLHREDGPAVTRDDGHGAYSRWFLENVEIAEVDFAEELDRYVLRRVMDS